MTAATHTPNHEAVSTEQAPQRTDAKPKRQPPYHVILHDDDHHSYEYVIGMVQRLFAKSAERAFELAKEVDSAGRTVVDTTTMERAELKRDQILAFGKDWRIPRCAGSMSATIEPVPQ